MTEQLARYTAAPMDEIERAATAMYKSKFFADVTSVEQAIVKAMAGQEIGIGPFASMNGIHIIQGKPTYGANILAAKVKGSGKYDYRVLEINEKVCAIEFFQGQVSLGKSTFTIEDARKSGTKNTDKFPRNMLFARAMSNGIKWFCPDVLQGVTAYVPEEFGAIVDDNNMIVDATVTDAPARSFTPAAPVSSDITGTEDEPGDEITEEEARYLDACAAIGSDGVRYGDRTDEKLGWVIAKSKQPEKVTIAKTILDWRKAHGVTVK